MGMEAKCGGLAVAAGAAVRRPLQPRDTNVAASTVVVGKAAAPKPKAHPRAGTWPAALPSLPPPPAAPLFQAQCGVSVAAGVAEVSLAEELEKARERRARLRAAREQTEREMESRAETMERAAAEDQRRLVSELMRLIGMPEVYTPVESLRSKEERKRSGAIVARSGSTGSILTASTSQADFVVKHRRNLR